MNKHFKKIISLAAGLAFLVFLVFLPQILTRGTVKSFDLFAKIFIGQNNSKTGGLPAASLVPIEKIGFFHFRPGEKTYFLDNPSLCLEEKNCRPEKIIAEIKNEEIPILSLSCPAADNSCLAFSGLAETAEKNGLAVVLAMNAGLDNGTLGKIIPPLAALKMEIAETGAGAQAEMIKKNILSVKAAGKHLEISFLLTEKIDEKNLKNIIALVKKTAGTETAVHFSGTTAGAETIKNARQQAIKAGLKYAYAESIGDKEGETTYCPDGAAALERENYFLLKNNLSNNVCPDGTVIPGVWQ